MGKPKEILGIFKKEKVVEIVTCAKCRNFRRHPVMGGGLGACVAPVPIWADRGGSPVVFGDSRDAGNCQSFAKIYENHTK